MAFYLAARLPSLGGYAELGTTATSTIVSTSITAVTEVSPCNGPPRSPTRDGLEELFPNFSFSYLCDTGH